MSTDIQTKHFIYRYTPESWHPYIMLARLDRPIGTWLLLFPCWWSIVLAHDGIFRLGGTGWLQIFLFSLGALLMRSAGCIVNDLWDRKLDAQVERTKSRPLAAGTITPKQAAVFLFVLTLISFVILLSLQSMLATVLGVVSLALVAAYPYMKRITWWPQLFLGFTFNWGALMGWAAVENSISLAAILLYIGGIFWTLGYDTIYAHQDKDDDTIVGIKSTARLFGAKSKDYVVKFMGVAMIFMIGAKFMGSPSFITPVLLLIPSAHLYWQMKNWNPDNPESSLRIFRSNAIFGWLALLMFSL
jgi:4-hydroxybenzoate polyprenyltransferase